jgi:RNA polymerase sigma factor (TIGR02999 family)
MGTAKTAEVTCLLRDWGRGDDSALERLTALVHGELHRMARRYMANERPDHTLQATALVNEVYLKFVDVRQVDWRARAQFFAIAAQIMRHILVDAARARVTHKRGAGAVRVNIDDLPLPSVETESFVPALDEALERFAAIAPRQARVVELRYFGGLNDKEVAEVMKTSPRTVRRDWQFAKAWLQEELSGLG